MASRVAGGAVGAAKGYWQTSVSNPDAGFGDYVGAMASNAFYGIIDPISTSVSFATSAGGYYGAKALGAGEEEALMAMMIGDLTGMVAGGSIRSFKEALGRGAGMKAARTSALLSVAVDVGGMSAGGLYAAATGGDIWSGMQHGMTVASAGMAGVQLAKRICFAPETPLLTPGGSKPICEFKVGDYILSAPEYDPSGQVSVQVVEEVFENHMPLLNLHVGGQVIRTTAFHPFYVRGKGWTSCEELETGDLLRSHDGQWVAVEEVADAGEESVVYNLRVSEYHSYFVGGEAWGFSVWAHNACTKLASGVHIGTHGELRRAGIKDRHHIIQDASVRNQSGYSYSGAPAIELPGPSTQVGSAHYKATRVQDQPGGGTYAAERRIAYKTLRRAGLSKADARFAIQKADDYFIGQLGFTMNTPLTIPANRR